SLFRLFSFLCNVNGLSSPLCPTAGEWTMPPIDEPPAPAPQMASTDPWYKTLTGYQWFVFIVCCLAWDMDCMDQQLFNLARQPAMVELVPKVQPTDPRLPEMKKQREANAQSTAEADLVAAQQTADIGKAAGNATSIFLI